MKAKEQEAAGTVIASAVQAGMVYVPPTRHTIVAGWRCAACDQVFEHKPGCLPPFGLKREAKQ